MFQSDSVTKPERHTAYKLGLNRNLPPLVYKIFMRSEKVTKQSDNYRHILHARRQLVVTMAKKDVKQEATAYRKKLAK